MVELARQLRRSLLVVGVVLVVGCSDGVDGGVPPPTTRLPTRDEYAQAVAEAVRCLQERGFTSSSSEQDDGSFGIQVGAADGNSEAASDEIDAAYRECTDEHLNDLQTAYLDSIRPSEEEVGEIRAACFVEKGFVDDADISNEELEALYEELDDDPAFVECLDRPYEHPDLTPGG